MAAILKGWLRRRENRLLERVGRKGGGSEWRTRKKEAGRMEKGGGEG